MFDVWKSIFAGFTGKLKSHPEARRLVWLLIITGFFSLCCVFFAAYVSFSRYRDLAGILPGADLVAICFTIGIAGFIFFASAYIATFTAEIWIHGKTEMSGARAITFFVVGVIVAIGDYHMNVDGAYDVAQKAAGQIEVINEDAIRGMYADEIRTEEQKLQDLLAGNLGGYGWLDTKTGIYHLNNSGKRFQRSISQNIDRLRSQESQSISDERDRIAQANSERNTRKDQTHGRLLVVVRSVYIIQFFLCLVMALIGVAMAEAQGDAPLSKKEKKGSMGFQQGNNSNRTEEELQPAVAKKDPKKSPENPHSIQAQLARLRAEKEQEKSGKKTEEEFKPQNPQKNAQSFSENEGKNGDQKTFNFFANKPPDNKGKNYDMTAFEMKQVKKVQKAYEALVEKKQDLPTQEEIAARAKMSEPTARKYLRMMELPTKGNQ